MNAITGTVKNGQILLDHPADLPDGCRVLIEPVVEGETFGIREENWQDTPEAVAAWLQWYDTLEPLRMTPEEEAEWQADRKARKELEKARFDERAEKLRRGWE
jgi:hypothetical protein